MKRFSFLVIATALLISSLAAQAPHLVNYQGILTDDEGRPLDGTYDLTFKIYPDSLVATSPLWTETHAGLEISDGLFGVLLGSTNPLWESLFEDDERWLGITVGTVGIDPELSPRMRMTSVPWALRASIADSALVTLGGLGDGHSLDADDGDPGDVVYVNSDGDVDIGQTTQGADFTIYGDSGYGAKLFWNKSKGALKGDIDLNLDKIGAYSFSFGTNNETGVGSIALGSFCKATGLNAFAFGNLCHATNSRSFAFGYDVIAAAANSFALGFESSTSEFGSVAFGNDCHAGGANSYAIGYSSWTFGSYSMALGSNVMCNGYNSIALGSYLNSSANNTITIGHGSVAGSPIINDIENSLMVGFEAGPILFVGGNDHRVGIGTISPEEKLEVNGNLKADGIIMPSGAIDGYIMTSDASGVASWQPVSGTGDITAVNAGSGLSGGGTSGPVTLSIGSGAVTSTMIANSTIQFNDINRNSASTGQVIKWNGSSWSAEDDEMGEGGLDLPFSETTYYSGYAFQVINEGNSGTAIQGTESGSSGTGVYGSAGGSNGRGVHGYAGGSGGRGVYGRATDGGSTPNYGGYFTSSGDYGVGVYGAATNSGSYDNVGGYFTAGGYYGIGVYAEGGSGGYAADFRGNVRIRDASSGNTVLELGEGLDYAEGFDVSDANHITAGSVLVIDSDNPGKLTLSRTSYDSKVAGIVAGAEGLGSGVRLGVDQYDFDVALAGRVYCNVDATGIGIEPGDLLTTSKTPGYAMKATDRLRAHGTILGKAMEKLEKGKKAKILVLVTLQ